MSLINRYCIFFPRKHDVLRYENENSTFACQMIFTKNLQQQQKNGMKCSNATLTIVKFWSNMSSFIGSN